MSLNQKIHFCSRNHERRCIRQKGGNGFGCVSKRQLICFGGAALIGVPAFFLMKKVTGNISLSVMCMMVLMLPLFFLAMYERDGQPFEVVARHFIESKFIRPKIRPYQTDNYYSILERQAQAEKEVNQIVRKKQKNIPKKEETKEHPEKAQKENRRKSVCRQASQSVSRGR